MKRTKRSVNAENLKESIEKVLKEGGLSGKPLKQELRRRMAEVRRGNGKSGNR